MMINMKKILLIGKTGQLGGEIAKDANLYNFEIFSFKKEYKPTTARIIPRKITTPAIIADFMFK